MNVGKMLHESSAPFLEAFGGIGVINDVIGHWSADLHVQEKANFVALLQSEGTFLHQLRERRSIGSKKRGSPSPEDKREVKVNLMGFRQHEAPGHQEGVSNQVCADFAACWRHPHGLCWKVLQLFIHGAIRRPQVHAWTPTFGSNLGDSIKSGNHLHRLRKRDSPKSHKCTSPGVQTGENSELYDMGVLHSHS
eukprot:1015898-Pelagomonas_calceolata.AAC.1